MHGAPGIALLADVGIYAIHNAEALRRSGTGVAVALRDVRNEAEAEWVAEAFRSIEDKSGLGPGNLRVFLVVDSIQCIEALGAIAERFGRRICGYVIDPTGIGLSNAGNAPLNTAEEVSGALYEASARVVQTAHETNVPAVWGNSGDGKYDLLFTQLRVDGVLCASVEQVEACLESAEEHFPSANQIDSRPEASPSGNSGASTPTLNDVLQAFISADSGFTR